MSFDKEQYRENRNAGIRGQGVLPPAPEPTKEYIEKSAKDGSHLVNIGGKILKVNRKQSRQRYINRHATNGKTLPKTKEVIASIAERVFRTEKGEQERVAKKKAELKAE